MSHVFNCKFRRTMNASSRLYTKRQKADRVRLPPELGRKLPMNWTMDAMENSAVIAGKIIYDPESRKDSGHATKKN